VISSVVLRHAVAAAVLAGCSFAPASAPSDARRDADTGATDAPAGLDAPSDAASPLHCTLLLGSDHSCALRTADRSLWCVGENANGELGIGMPGGFSVTVTQVPLGQPVLRAGNRFFHTCALLADGTSRCWGQNDRFQLGDNTNLDRISPITVMNLASATEIASGRTFNCAVRTGGSVTCWGDNANGQLGDGSTMGRATPMTSVASVTSPVALALGASHACALLAGGTGMCWGTNTFGQLGNNSTTDAPSPIAMPITGIRQIAAGGYSTGTAAGGQTCALRTSGTVACWGSNEFGQLGNGTTSLPIKTPVEVMNLDDAVELVMGRYHVCARRSAGGVVCWGRAEQNQIGDSDLLPHSVPKAITLPAAAVAIAAGGYHTCALLADDTVYCWGGNGRGQLGDGTTLPRVGAVASSLCP